MTGVRQWLIVSGAAIGFLLLIHVVSVYGARNMPTL